MPDNDALHDSLTALTASIDTGGTRMLIALATSVRKAVTPLIQAEPGTLDAGQARAIDTTIGRLRTELAAYSMQDQLAKLDDLRERATASIAEFHPDLVAVMDGAG